MAPGPTPLSIEVFFGFGVQGSGLGTWAVVKV